MSLFCVSWSWCGQGQVRWPDYFEDFIWSFTDVQSCPTWSARISLGYCVNPKGGFKVLMFPHRCCYLAYFHCVRHNDPLGLALPTRNAWPIFTSHTSAFNSQVSGMNSYADLLISKKLQGRTHCSKWVSLMWWSRGSQIGLISRADNPSQSSTYSFSQWRCFWLFPPEVATFFGGGEINNLFVLGERRGNKQDTFPYFSTESGSIHKFPHVLSGNWP